MNLERTTWDGRPATASEDLRARQRLDLERYLALVATFGAAIPIFVFSGLRLGGAMALVLAPLWIPSVRHYRHGLRFIVLGLGSWLSGLVLTEAHRGSLFVDDVTSRFQSLDFLGFLAVVGLLLWARATLGTRAVGIVYGAGLVVSIPLTLAGASANYWKFALALPITVLLLSLLGSRRQPRIWPLLLGLFVLLVLTSAFDSRSFAGALAFAVGLLAWQRRPPARSPVQWWGWSALVLAAAAVGMYFIGTALLVNGALGTETQQRTVRQVETAGSLLLGGRPEIMATAALVTSTPEGFGFGVQVDTTQLNEVKTSMETINYRTQDNKYVDVFMFGQAIELHSVVADLWAMCGLLGAATGVLLVITLVRGVVESGQRRQAGAVTLFLAAWALFELGFGPFFSAVPGLVLAVALNFPTIERVSTGGGHRVGDRSAQEKERAHATS